MPALVQTLQRPPDGFDVGGVHRPVGVVHVDPEADPPCQVLPIPDVSPDGHAASLVELGDPERLDVALAGRSDLLLHFDLDRQAVTVPSGLAVHEVAGHRAVARVDVLERAGDRVADVRLGVRRRRSVVEDPLRGALALRERTREDVGLVPEREDRAARARGTAPSDRPAGTGGLRRSPSARLPTRETPRPRFARTRREAPRYHLACGTPHGIPPLTAAFTACRCHGRTRLRLLRAGDRLGSGRGSGRMSARCSAPGSHRPRLALAPPSPRRVPVVACRVHATHVGSVTVRVMPRSGRTAWRPRPTGSWCARRPRAAAPGDTCFRRVDPPPGPALPREGLRAGRHDGRPSAATTPGSMTCAGSRKDGLMRQRATLRPHAAGQAHREGARGAPRPPLGGARRTSSRSSPRSSRNLSRQRNRTCQVTSGSTTSPRTPGPRRSSGRRISRSRTTCATSCGRSTVR